jgi:hypothetical protein
MSADIIYFPGRREADADSGDLRERLSAAYDVFFAARARYHGLILQYWRANGIKPCNATLCELIPDVKARKKWRIRCRSN